MRDLLHNWSYDLRNFPQKYISDVDIRKRITVLKAYFGAGKTQLAINYIRQTGREFVYLAPLIALVNDAIGRFNAEGLQSYTHNELKDQGLFAEYRNSFGSCFESLSMRDLAGLKGHIFILDEYTAILNQIHSHINKDRRNDLLMKLEWILKNCKVFIFDALMEEHDIQNLYDVSEQFFKMDIEIIDNKGFQPVNRELFNVISKGYFQSLILKECEKHPVLLMTDNVAIANLLCSQIENSINLCAETRDELLNNDTISRLIEEKKPQFMTISPTGHVGMNVHAGFNAVFIYADNHSITDYRTYLQAIHRLRDYSVPVYLYTNKISSDPFLKTDALQILADMQSKENSLNKCFKDFLDEEGYYCTNPENQKWEIYLAEKQAWINQQSVKGLSSYIREYFAEQGIIMQYLTDENDTLERPSAKETKAEKLDKLINAKLPDETEYKALKKKQYCLNASPEDKLRIRKYETAEKFGILKAADSEQKANDLYLHTVNEDKLERIADNYNMLMKSDAENYETEKRKYQQTVTLERKSETLEKMAFGQALQYFRDRIFSNKDVPSDIVDYLELFTGKSFKAVFAEQIVNRKCFSELKKRLMSMEGFSGTNFEIYAYAISRGEREAIDTLYADELRKIKHDELTAYMKKFSKGSLKSEILKREILKGAKKVFFDKMRTYRKSSKFNKIASKKRALAHYEKYILAHCFDIESEKEKLDKRILKRQDKFRKSIQERFTVSPVSILSDWFAEYGVKIELTGKSMDRRFYRLDTSFFDRYSKLGQQNENRN